MSSDTFGNPIDPVAGFARGSIITSSTEEALRLRNAQHIAAHRVRSLGAESIGVFTGNQRDYPIEATDIATLCEEWVGPGLFADDLRTVVLEHLGGATDHQVAIFNRTSAGIIAAIVALAPAGTVLSVVPQGGRSHASVVHGSRLAAATLIEAAIDTDWTSHIARTTPQLVVITTVTSSLERMDDDDIADVVDAARTAGSITLLDEAYGARLRTALHGGALSLHLGAHLSITNCDKAGLAGPRAGALAGSAHLVAKVAATGASFGMEARAPIAAGALRSFQRYTPELLRDEARSGHQLSAALTGAYPAGVVRESDLGPMIHEDDVLRELLRMSGSDDAPGCTRAPVVVPCEATSALGALLLRDHGILTTNTHGQPGARVSLRLKPTVDAIDRIGGIGAVVAAVAAATKELATLIDDRDAIAALILGDAA
ncbi:hypothetical protein [Mycobacterium sp. 236(2023)]|uniref:hypothetical protein n=1 Tax=Mycobacterium sp. 236(2023) TaxID=3038163 RepID=UPI00241544BB|nr:hypothetical protein [Mycobacterium sp. 236(2023)]MDG4669342.1 hypothetical protein [Mycobacterium sp. 236(2023)]